MADGSRESNSSQEPGSHLPASIPSTDPKKPRHEFPKSQVGKLWDAFGDPEERVNVLANASYKPPGKNLKDVSYSEVIGEISISELSSVYKYPCGRESLLTGIGAGFGIGGVRAVIGGMCILIDLEVSYGSPVLQPIPHYGLLVTGLSEYSLLPH